MRNTLILAAAYNFGGGLIILLFLDSIGPLINFHDSGQGLFRMFAGGTAVLFGFVYISVFRNYPKNRPLLVYGTALKYWVFLISVFGFSFADLSLQVLLLFGGINLVFAVLFTRYLAHL